MNYTPSPHIDPNKIFLVKRSELEDRLEPKYYTERYIANLAILNSSKYPKTHLSEVTHIISDGTHFTPIYLEKGVKFISVKDVRKSHINLANSKYISEDEAEKLDKRCKPQKDDILLTKIGATFGFAATVETNERFQIFVSLALLRPNQKIYPKYLEIFLNTDLAYIQFERIIKGAGVPDLHLEDIRRIKIALPILSVQNKIVALFQTAYTAKQQKEAEAKALLESIDTYLLGELGISLPAQDHSLEKRIFTKRYSELAGERLDSIFYASDLMRFYSGKYSSVSLKSVSISFKSGIGAGKQDQAIDQNGIIQIRPTNIDENGLLKFDRNIYLPFDAKADTLDVDDVLFNNTNSQELVGKTAIVKEQKELCYSNHITRIKVDQNKLVPDFLWVILNVYQKNKVFYSICTNWNNQSGIGLELLKSLKIPVPPLNKQTEIANHIQNIHSRAKALQHEAARVLEEAKREVEKMILGE
jgi:type I restriction enzyme S subunit